MRRRTRSSTRGTPTSRTTPRSPILRRARHGTCLPPTARLDQQDPRGPRATPGPRGRPGRPGRPAREASTQASWPPSGGTKHPVRTAHSRSALYPRGVAFDGTSIWVANYFSDNVTKLRASDGAALGTFAVGSTPDAVAFDGTSIWVTNLSKRDQAPGQRRRRPGHLPRRLVPRCRGLRRHQHLGRERWQQQRDQAQGQRRRRPGHLPRRLRSRVPWPSTAPASGSRMEAATT